MSEDEVRRAGVLQRVGRGELKQSEAAELLGLSYRQTKRLQKRYREQGAQGLVHRNAGRRSHHGKPEGLRKKALQLVREYYSGAPGERFGPTLAAEHLKQEHGLEVDHETLRRWMLQAGLWSRNARAVSIGSGETGRNTLASCCRWTAASTIGWRGEAGEGV